MRQLIRVFLFEVKMSIQSFYAGYIVVAPAIMVLVLRLFVPTVENTTVTVAVVAEGAHSVAAGVLEELSSYADVVRYDSIEQVRQKLRGAGSAEGLYWDPGTEQYVSLLERNVAANTLFSAGARAVRRHVYEREYDTAQDLVRFSSAVPPELSTRTGSSPIATMGGAVFMALLTILTGFLVGLSVVRDKNLGTDRAIRVSPVTKGEYYVGKSVFPILLFLAYIIIGAVVLGLTAANVLMLYVVAALSVSVVLLIGLVVGAFARNETEAIGLVKSTSMVLMLGVLGGALLPDRWQWIVYWVPQYWIFDIAEEIYTLTATWADVIWKSGVVFGLSAAAYGALRSRIMKGLS